MAKQAPGFERYTTALVACLVALAPADASFGQLPQVPSPPYSGPSDLPPVPTDSAVANDPHTNSDSRLTTVESQLQQLLEAEARRNGNGGNGNGGSRPTFQMGGQLNIDYLFIGQNAANRAS